MGERIGSEGTQQIGAITVDEDGQIRAESDDPGVASDLNELIRRQLRTGGFVCQMSRFEPNDFRPERHVVYAIKQRPQDRHFGWALESTVSMFWTGERVGDYEINGFASYLTR
jgi:hypothetical protein